MPYIIDVEPTFEKDIKGFKKQAKLKAEIAVWIEKIIDNPELGEHLKGSWEGFRKIAFHSKPQMRIIYRLYPCCDEALKSERKCRFADEPIQDCLGLIDFIFVRTREDCNNLYAQSRKYTEGFTLE